MEISGDVERLNCRVWGDSQSNRRHVTNQSDIDHHLLLARPRETTFQAHELPPCSEMK